ncbi:hypothetical protein LSUE1_G002398 [Lachnellula suecica]|uniref:Uncharacterized protein n=1 Tax=Lachnellula suecica TaxID=602035 RepID=A0A8T9CAC7_9HELO|nr:hypothetical protein LSUE1_G002398 [Lachnellula suecica]
MSSENSQILDCKVEARNYILVLHPSRWGKKRDRVIVHSPVPGTSTKTNHLKIPVKRHDEEQNSVCFLPRADIEQDTDDIYKRLNVNRNPYSSNAHGVALCASLPRNGFEYRRGDCFWLHIESNTSVDDNCAPVINLRTFDIGYVALDDVCWYPQVQTKDELWTLGGVVQSLKLAGPRNYTYLSWVVCQKLDGSRSTTKYVKIPTKDAKLDDRWQLVGDQSQSLFEEKYRHMETSYKNSAQCVTPRQTPPTPAAEALPKSPPSTVSFPQATADPLAETTIHDQIGEDEAEPGIELWKRIFKFAGPLNGSYKMLSPSLIHSTSEPACTSLQVPLQKSGTSEMTDYTDIYSDSDDDEPTSSTNSPRHSVGQLAIVDGLKQMDGSGLRGAMGFMEICRDEQSEDAIWPTKQSSHEHSNQKSIIASRYSNLCDLGDSMCAQTSTKCELTACEPPISPAHEHCILRSLLGKYGPCLLADKPRMKHTCCYRNEQERVNWPEKPEYLMREYELGKWGAQKMKIQLIDRSAWINRKLQDLPHVEDKIKEYSYGGDTQFLHNLERGDYNKEISGLRDVWLSSEGKGINDGFEAYVRTGQYLAGFD